jgi:hypothetical protein
MNRSSMDRKVSSSHAQPTAAVGSAAFFLSDPGVDMGLIPWLNSYREVRF